jgi:hypothetical protein
MFFDEKVEAVAGRGVGRVPHSNKKTDWGRVNAVSGCPPSADTCMKAFSWGDLGALPN